MRGGKSVREPRGSGASSAALSSCTARARLADIGSTCGPRGGVGKGEAYLLLKRPPDLGE